MANSPSDLIMKTQEIEKVFRWLETNLVGLWIIEARLFGSFLYQADYADVDIFIKVKDACVAEAVLLRSKLEDGFKKAFEKDLDILLVTETEDAEEMLLLDRIVYSKINIVIPR
jgi:hypothetical protein